MNIHDLLNLENELQNVTIYGWIKSRRNSKEFSFLEINDGSTIENIQCIINDNTDAMTSLNDANTGSSVKISGQLVASPGQKQRWEIIVKEITVLGKADPETYPLQKKRHSDEFLRTIAHLRPRTNKYGAMLRIRSESAFAIHDFFRQQGFYWVHTPILTGADCEGAGEMFKLDTDLFTKPCHLTVSGQLEAETMALALSKVYTFGPTFRAENSNTQRHAAEFWMVEPEVAFTDLSGIIDLAEKMLKFILTHILSKCSKDIDLFNKFIDTELIQRLELMRDKEFIRISYAEAINILQNSKKDFSYPVSFGIDLQTEHERFLAEEYFKLPVFVFNYPKDIKAFYMRLNDDNATVAAVDLLVPRIGELIGGSQREERQNILEKRISELNQDIKDYWWYLDLRKYGTTPHSGFGLGFERLIMLLTGISNIRDVIPFPRTPGSLDF